MTLTDIIAEMEKDARQPTIVIDAHKKTLEALLAFAKRLDKLEKRK